MNNLTFLILLSIDTNCIYTEAQPLPLAYIVITSAQKFLLVDFIQYVVRDRSYDSFGWNKLSNSDFLLLLFLFLVNCERI